MNKTIMALLLSFFISSCANHQGRWGDHGDCNHSSCSNHNSCDDNCQHHEGMYDMNCAYSMSQGNEIKGNKSHHWNHKGKSYYFSSEENMKKFKKDVDENVERANKNWNRR